MTKDKNVIMQDNNQMKTTLSEFTPIPWWLAVVNCLEGESIVIGEFGQDDIGMINSKSNIISKLSVNELLAGDMPNNSRMPDIILANLSSVGYDDALSHILKHYDACKNIIIRCSISRSSNAIKKQSLVNKIMSRRLRKKISKFNNSNFEMDYALAYDCVIHESYHSGDYFTNKDILRTRQKIKAILIKLGFSELISNEILIYKSDKPNFFRKLELELNEIKKNIYKVSSVLYKYGKCVVTLIEETSGKAIVCIATFSREAYYQRANEKNIVDELINTRQLEKYVKNRVEYREIDGVSCFIMDVCEGISIDLPISGIHQNLELAVELLCNSIEFSSSINHSNESLSSWLSEKRDKITRRLPTFSYEISQIQRQISERHKISPLKRCLMHGDYKLENVLFKKNGGITGIIDWELAESTGFPFIDILYLLAYFSWTVNGESFSEHFTRMVDGKINSIEETYISKYAESKGLRRSDLDDYLRVYFMHHFSERFHIHESKTKRLEAFTIPLTKIMEMNNA